MLTRLESGNTCVTLGTYALYFYDLGKMSFFSRHFSVILSLYRSTMSSAKAIEDMIPEEEPSFSLMKVILNDIGSLKKSFRKKRSSEDAGNSFRIMDDKRVLDLIEVSRNGMGYEKFKLISGNMPFSKTDWSRFFDITERTLLRIEKEKRALSKNQSERVIELAELIDYGVVVFGDKTNFEHWMDRNSLALGGIKPKDLLDTSHGIKMVHQELGKIEHGILA